jgi:hypothetical protein
LILSIVFYRKLHKYLLQIISGLLIMVILLTGFQLFNYFGQENKLLMADTSEKHDFFGPELLTFSSQQNIIHIVLDDQQSTITEEFLARNPQAKEQLDGFVFFPNTSTNYHNTFMAISTLFRNGMYKHDMDLNVFIDEALNDSQFLTILQESGYQTAVHTLPGFCAHTKEVNCTSIPSISSNVGAFLLLDYSVFKSIPDMLKPRIYRNEDWWISDRFVNSNYYSTHTGYAYELFKNFNQNITVADIPPTYKFYHSMITHNPFVLDAECGLLFKKQSRASMDSRLMQATCAFNQVFSFLDKLRELGVYDNSLIIISSDHGSAMPVAEQQTNLEKTDIAFKFHSAGLSTLFIKPIDSHGLLQVSTVPVTLFDIPNTILASINLPLLPEGENIFSLSTTETRTRNFISFQGDAISANKLSLPPSTVFTIHGDVRDATSWTMECSDQEHMQERVKPCTN